jgi:hypothetical protein
MQPPMQNSAICTSSTHSTLPDKGSIHHIDLWCIEVEDGSGKRITDGGIVHLHVSLKINFY